MNLEEAFLRDILEHPDDVSRRLIYADWLEEQGDPASLAKAETLRLESALTNIAHSDPAREQIMSRLREVRAGVGARWRAALARVPIELCTITFKFRCPKQWQSLRPTEDPQVRFCHACHKSVYYCHIIEEARQHARSNHCVAIDPSVDRRPGDVSHRPILLGGVALAPPIVPLPTFVSLPLSTPLVENRQRTSGPTSPRPADHAPERALKSRLPRRPRRRRWSVEEEEEEGHARKRTH